MLNSIIFIIVIFTLFLFFHLVIWRFHVNHSYGVYHILILQFFILVFSITCNNITSIIDIDNYFVSSSYLMLIMLYLHFYVGITRSVSIRILGEILSAKELSMSLDSIEKIYPAKYMLQHRLETLVDHGWLSFDNEQYTCTDKGRMIANGELLMKYIYTINQTG